MENNMTVREATIFVLNESERGFQALKESFVEAANSFETAHDTKGLEIIQEKIIPPVKDLCHFCASIKLFHQDVLDADTRELFNQQLIALEEAMKEIIEAD